MLLTDDNHKSGGIVKARKHEWLALKLQDLSFKHSLPCSEVIFPATRKTLWLVESGVRMKLGGLSRALIPPSSLSLVSLCEAFPALIRRNPMTCVRGIQRQPAPLMGLDSRPALGT